MLLALVLAALALAASACGEGNRLITDGAPRLRLTVHVQLTANLAEVARNLKWPLSGVPAASVVLQRAGDTSLQGRDSVATDASGIAIFAELFPGRYQIRVRRRFSDSERRNDPQLTAGVEELVGSLEVLLDAPPGAQALVTLTALEQGALIISEVFPSSPLVEIEHPYYFGGYFEIHNNGAVAVPLAGKMWFSAWPGWLRSPLRPNGCSVFTPIERDPNGIWLSVAYRFPPSARALDPGKFVLLVTDAIDHRLVARAPGFFDLRDADFEFPGTSDVDNPRVPNMEPVGPRQFVGDGHGFRFNGGRQVWGLAEFVNLDSVPQWTDPVVGLKYVRLPMNALLDLVRYNWNVPHFDPSFVDCPSAILPSVDADDAVLLTVIDTLAIHRRIARTLPDGRVIFQRSRNSAADWAAGAGTPGQVP